jgi:hypothetical protein
VQAWDLEEPNGLRWKEADAYWFDIDGTLLLSPDRAHRCALNRTTLDVFGVETTMNGMACRGKIDPGILRAVLEHVGITRSP